MTPVDPFFRIVLGSATIAVELLLPFECCDGSSLSAFLDRAVDVDDDDLLLLVDLDGMTFFVSGCAASIRGAAFFVRVDLTISSWTMTKKLVRC